MSGLTYFKKPIGYQCVVRQNDDTLYAYQGYNRDTYNLINGQWKKTYSYSSSTYHSYSGYNCLSDEYIVPNSILAAMFLPATLFILAFFKVIMNMFMGIKR